MHHASNTLAPGKKGKKKKEEAMYILLLMFSFSRCFLFCTSLVFRKEATTFFAPRFQVCLTPFCDELGTWNRRGRNRGRVGEEGLWQGLSQKKGERDCKLRGNWHLPSSRQRREYDGGSAQPEPYGLWVHHYHSPGFEGRQCGR